ncbi:hypothetical protein MMU07_03515 [Aquiflexum sp. LQ15W]|nr:hypothetical protein [Cognataquiflexum nitidum]MCH6198634.1 hypothetical protein [Cognataquiflexum nitidum]
MKTYRVKMIPKKGGSIIYVLMQAQVGGVLYSIAEAAYPGFKVLQVEEAK